MVDGGIRNSIRSLDIYDALLKVTRGARADLRALRQVRGDVQRNRMT